MQWLFGTAHHLALHPVKIDTPSAFTPMKIEELSYPCSQTASASELTMWKLVCTTPTGRCLVFSSMVLTGIEPAPQIPFAVHTSRTVLLHARAQLGDGTRFRSGLGATRCVFSHWSQGVPLACSTVRSSHTRRDDRSALCDRAYRLRQSPQTGAQLRHVAISFVLEHPQRDGTVQYP